jgi:hypothetical protein
MSAAASVLPGDEQLAPAEPQRKLRGTHWVDYGLDTGPRLRVAGIYEGEEADKRIAVQLPEQTRDDAADQELHELSAKALREGDDHTLGKLYEDLFDELHSVDFGEERTESRALLAYAELEAALAARLREESRRSKWGWKFRLTAAGLALRVRLEVGVLECRVSKPELAARIAQAHTDPRGAADELIALAVKEVSAARAKMLFGQAHEVPVETERAQA